MKLTFEWDSGKANALKSHRHVRMACEEVG